MSDRDWRDAKLPVWAKEAVNAEIDAWRLTAALSWPTEAKPEPLPFRWGDYDNLYGEPKEGAFWGVTRGVTKIEIRRKTDADSGWKEWRFRGETADWSTCVYRGPLFETEREARLYGLWIACEGAARELMKLREEI